MTVTDEEFFKCWAGLVKDINSTIQRAAQPSNFRGQGRIIDLIAHHEGCSQRELAALAGVKPGSLTEVLERLERNAYVIRRRDDRDRRVIRVDLTKRGRCLHAELTAQRVAFVRYLLKNVGPEERQQFVQVIDKIRVQLHKYDGGSFMKNEERDEDK